MAKITVSQIVNALKGCVDPEIGLDIVELGLIQGIEIDDSDNVKVEFISTMPDWVSLNLLSCIST